MPTYRWIPGRPILWRPVPDLPGTIALVVRYDIPTDRVIIQYKDRGVLETHDGAIRHGFTWDRIAHALPRHCYPPRQENPT